MCLSTVSTEKPPDSGVFYKVFVSYGTWFRLPYTHDFPVSLNSWNTRWARDPKLQTNDGVLYDPGFHGFTTKSGAERYRDYLERSSHSNPKVIECRYRGGATLGTHHIGAESRSENAIVVQEMFVPEEA
jgi:hypothetical protein